MRRTIAPPTATSTGRCSASASSASARRGLSAEPLYGFNLLPAEGGPAPERIIPNASPTCFMVPCGRTPVERGAKLAVITNTYDLILCACHHISRFPRNHRFVLGERIERHLYDLLEMQRTDIECTDLHQFFESL